MSSAGSTPNNQGFPQNNAPVVDPDRNYQWTTYWLRFMMNLWARTGAAQGSGTNPTGITAPWLVDTPPQGWLICNGQAVSRVIYAALFTVIGTRYGSGDGASTFNLPDFRNRFLIGAGNAALGTAGGADNFSLSTANLPSHSHTITDPGHAHTTWDASSTNTAGAVAGAITTGGMTGTAMTGITATNNTGSGDPVDYLPPYGAVNWIIKT